MGLIQLIATFDLNAEEKAVLRRAPWRIEAGTPDIASVLGFGAAVRFLEDIGMQRIHDYTL